MNPPARPRCQLLEDLPAELRNLIWSHVFRAPTGKVVICPSYTYNKAFIMDEYLYWSGVRVNPVAHLSEDSTGAMSFSLLRTCKQTYTETRDLAWKLNTVVLAPKSWLLSPIKTSRNIDLTKLVHVEFNIHLEDIEEWQLQSMKTALEALGLLADNGNPKTFTLSLSRDWLYIYDLDSDNGFRMTARNLFEAWMFLLRNSEIKDSFSTSFRRNIVINTGLQPLCPETEEFYKPRSISYEDIHHCSVQTVLCTLKELYIGYGSELWQYGKFCYRDGTLVPFKLGQCAEEECERRLDLLVPKHLRPVGLNEDSSEERNS